MTDMRQVGERSEGQTWEAEEHGSGEMKGHIRKRQHEESRKVKGQVRSMRR